jgi:mannose-1-phosphate guanylyltransferase
MILAAGLGTRLRPLTNDVPKPLLWLGDRPQIDHITATLAAAGLDRVVVNTHHLSEQFDDAWALRPLAVDIFEPGSWVKLGIITQERSSEGPRRVERRHRDRLDVAALVAARKPAARRWSSAAVGGGRGAGPRRERRVRRVRALVLDGEVASAITRRRSLSQALRDASRALAVWWPTASYPRSRAALTRRSARCALRRHRQRCGSLGSKPRLAADPQRDFVHRTAKVAAASTP